MAGYWPSSFLCVFNEVKVHGKNSSNNNNKLAGKLWAIPCWQDRPILPARVANHNTGFTYELNISATFFS